MRIFVSLVAVAGLAVSSHGALAKQTAAASPTAVSAKAVLAKARAASGAVKGGHKALVATGDVEASGLKGTWSRREDLATGRWVVATDMGVFRTAEGFDGNSHWRQDPSGGVHALNAAFAKKASVTEAWLSRRGWLRPDADREHIASATTRIEGDRSFVVIDAVPRGGQPIELWFDAATWLLDRTVRTMPISTQTVRYADYRSVSGTKLPFTLESRDSGSSDVEVVHVHQWVAEPVVDSLAFASPNPPDDTTLDGETTIAVEIDGFVAVQATLNGRVFDFILDTGGHNIITPAVAAALGVQPVGGGASGGAGSGELPQQYVRIEQVSVGAATMRDQHFYVLPFPYDTVERGARPPLAGLLGLELFERFAVRLDYPQKKLTLQRSERYRHSGSGRAVPIVFDDDMPLLYGRIDGVRGLFGLDTGNAGTTVIQSVWARTHGMADRLKRGIETVSYGTGGASTNWASRVDNLEIGGTVIERPIVRYAEDRAGSFSSRTEAANVGTDILSNFVLDFDYRRGLIWFDYRPGHVPQPFNRSGMRTIKETPEAFRVTRVVAQSPAADSGIARDDEIIAVDGTAASAMSGSELLRKLTQPAGTEVALTIRRNNEQRRATLTLREMLP